jgi:hypothetical protein
LNEWLFFTFLLCSQQGASLFGFAVPAPTAVLETKKPAALLVAPFVFFVVQSTTMAASLLEQRCFLVFPLHNVRSQNSKQPVVTL